MKPSLNEITRRKQSSHEKRFREVLTIFLEEKRLKNRLKTITGPSDYWMESFEVFEIEKNKNGILLWRGTRTP